MRRIARYYVPLLAVLVFAVITVAARQTQEPVTSAALQGAWKLASLSYDGVPQKAIGYLIFHGNHYSFITTRERPKFTEGIGGKSVEQLTSAEKDSYVEAFRSMTAAAGPYTIEKGEIGHMREVVRSPNLVGQVEHRKSWFEGGRLIQDFQGGGRRQVYVWERVSAPKASAGNRD